MYSGLWKGNSIPGQHRTQGHEREPEEIFNEHESRRNGEGIQTYVNGGVYCA